MVWAYLELGALPTNQCTSLETRAEIGYPIQNSSQENAIVLDTFGGSGSTLMACQQTNRICYAMELDEKYASVILRRYVEDTGDADGVFVLRGGERIAYSQLVKEVEAHSNDELEAGQSV